MYLASFKWPGRDEPLLIGRNKQKVHKAAYHKALGIYGTGPVNRPKAMCSAKIQMDDIEVVEIEEVL